ncbi:MAG: hypothetical protein K8J08_10360, partial [Thermoanaerobaculia bacterium]|nr:hypothetical protein [Thermoanaerobaculia bacterium]
MKSTLFHPRLLLVGLLLLPAGLLGEELSIELDLSEGEWIERNYPLALAVSNWPQANEGRLAIVIDDLDVSDLFRRESDRLVYRPELMPLPRGESEMVIYLVSADGGWTELARHPIRVRQPGGFEAVSARPTLDIEVQGTHDPEGGDDQNGQTETRATGQFRLESSALRQGWAYGFEVGILGVSEREEALRFSTDGKGAPQIDLSSYLATVSNGGYRLEVGHVSVGQSRQLMSGFSSRGLSLALPLGSRVTFGAGVLNGTQVVGWDNLLGLSESQHRVDTASVGVELLSRPGGLRLDGTWLDATILPLSNFGQGNLQDREVSSGWGVSLQSSTGGGRFALRGGFSRSTFTNPQDLLLGQGSELVGVVEETRGAQFAEIDLNLFRTMMGEGDIPVSLDLSVKHQRVDPLYRSIGASVSSDIEENGGELRATVG